MMQFLLTAALVLIIMLVIYFLVKRFWPTYGTIVANLVVSIPVFAGEILDAIGSLPWATVIEAKTAAAVLFAVAVGNKIIRLLGAKKAVGSP
jgi:hypothetical protein